jgi:hypothetical protein
MGKKWTWQEKPSYVCVFCGTRVPIEDLFECAGCGVAMCPDCFRDSPVSPVEYLCEDCYEISDRGPS